MRTYLKNRKVLLSSILLFITAFLWGLAFVFQTTGMKTIGPITFNAIRFLLGGIFLIPVYLIMNRERILKKENIFGDKSFKEGIKGGSIIGIILLFAAMTQQSSLLFTTVGKAGFITVLYIVIVPIIHFIMGDKISKRIVFCIILSIIGLYFLTMKGSFFISYGDLLVLMSAIIYSFHIMTIDKYSKIGNSLVITITQFLIAGILSLIWAMLVEKPTFSNILYAYKAIIYTGIFSCGIGYTLQVIGQRNLNPTIASLIMSLESVFAALSAYFILRQVMSGKEIIGCILVFIATLIPQIPENKSDKFDKLRG